MDQAFEENSHKNVIYTTLDEQNEAEHTTEKEKKTYVSTPLSRQKKGTLLSNQWKRDLEICPLNT